jgi:hypothetical protein
MEPSYFTPPPGQLVSTLDATASLSTSSGAVTPIILVDRIDLGRTYLTKKRESIDDLEVSLLSSVYARLCRRFTLRVWRWTFVLTALIICIQLCLHLYSTNSIPHQWRPSNTLHKHPNPMKWLRENSYPNDVKTRSRRPKAALISLVRNEELDGILQSMRQLEAHWNHRHKYPWVFFNEKPFSKEFKVRLPTVHHFFPSLLTP